MVSWAAGEPWLRQAPLFPGTVRMAEAGLRGSGQQPVAPQPPHFRGKLQGSVWATLVLSQGLQAGWWVRVGGVSGEGLAPQRLVPEDGPHCP